MTQSWGMPLVMSDDRAAAADSQPDLENLASALQVNEAIVAGVRPEQAHLPTPCPEYDVTQLLDHLVGYATSFADKAGGVKPAADPTAVTAGDDPHAAYREASDRLIDGYRDDPGSDATPIGVVLVETITHGWDLATATGQATPYPDDAVAAARVACEAMLSPQYRGAGMPFGDEVQVSASAPELDRLIGFMGRDPRWTA